VVDALLLGEDSVTRPTHYVNSTTVKDEIKTLWSPLGAAKGAAATIATWGAERADRKRRRSCARIDQKRKGAPKRPTRATSSPPMLWCARRVITRDLMQREDPCIFVHTIFAV